MIKKQIEMKMNTVKIKTTDIMDTLINPRNMYNRQPNFKNLTLLHQATQYVMNHIKTPEKTFQDIAQNSTKILGFALTAQFIVDTITPFKDYIPHYETLYSQIPKKKDGTLDLKILDHEVLDLLEYETAVLNKDYTIIKAKVYHIVISWKKNYILTHEFLRLVSDIRKVNAKNEYTYLVFYMLDSKLKYNDEDYMDNTEIRILEELVEHIKEHKSILNKIAFRSKKFNILVNELYVLQKKLTSYCQQLAIPELFRDLETTSLFVDPKSFKAFLASVPHISGLYFDIVNTMPDFKAISTSKSDQLIFLNCVKKDFVSLPEELFPSHIKKQPINIKSTLVKPIKKQPDLTPVPVPLVKSKKTRKKKHDNNDK